MDEQPGRVAEEVLGKASPDAEEQLPPLEGDDEDFSTAAVAPSSNTERNPVSRRQAAMQHEFTDRASATSRSGQDGADAWGSASVDAQVQKLFLNGRSPSLEDYEVKQRLRADTTVLSTDPVLQMYSPRQRAEFRAEAEENDLRQLAQMLPAAPGPSDGVGLRGSQETVSATRAAPPAPELSAEQRYLVWQDRKNKYSALHRKILITLESHHTLMDKALLLLELHDIVIRNRIRLRADMYEDIFFAMKLAVPYYNLDLKMKPVNSTTMLTEGWTMYRYALDSGTNPTPHMLEKMMSFLNTTRVVSADIESKAHQVMLDVDKYKLRPTAHFLNQYYHICTRNNATHIAVMKLVEAKKKHEIPPSHNDVALILQGFRAEGRADDGLKFLSNISTITVSSSLLEAIVHVARDSKNPISAFTFYKSMAPAGFRPGHRIIGSLLQVQEATNNFTNTLFLLEEVVKYKVQLIELHINMLLVALTRIRAKKEFSKLVATMHAHGKNIHTEKFPPAYRELVAEVVQSETQRRSTISSRGGKHSAEFRRVHNPNSGASKKMVPPSEDEDI